MSSPLKITVPRVGSIFPGEQIEEGGFARAVRPDNRVGAAALDLDRHVIDGDQSAKFFAQVHAFPETLIFAFIK